MDLLRRHPQAERIKPGERGSALASHIEHTVTGIEAKLADAASNFASATDLEKSEYIKRARLLNAYARFMHKAVPWISAAARPSLDLGARYFIDEFGQQICGGKPDAIPNPSNEFSTEWWPFRFLYAALSLTAQPGPVPIVLNFPEREAAAHLLLPLYGHELGHTAVSSNHLDQRVLDAHNGDAAFNTELAAACADVAATTGQTPKEAAIGLGWRLSWWITELLCDQLAIQVLGPSFLYAFSSFLLADAWDETGERHPPTCMRVEHLLAYAVQSGWDVEMRSRTPVTLRWLEDEVAATPPKATDRAAQFLLYAMAHMRDTIRSAAMSYLGATVYTPTGFSADMAAIAEFADREVLPAQLPNGDPIDRRAIMQAAWLSLLEVADRPETLASAPADVRTQAFFAKAIEMSALLDAWTATA